MGALQMVPSRHDSMYVYTFNQELDIIVVWLPEYL